MNKSQEFNDARHFLDRFILREMEITKGKSTTFLNKKTKKVKKVVVDEEQGEEQFDINEDGEKEVRKPKKKEPVEDRTIVHEYFLSAALCKEMCKHYEYLGFTWTEVEDTIIISWN